MLIRNLRIAGNLLHRAHTLLGRQNIRHLYLMLEPFGGFLERGRQVEDDLVILPDNDPSIGDAAAIKIAMYPEMQRLGFIAGAQKIGMERMNILLVIHRAIGSDDRLSDHLTTENPFARG